MFMPVASSSPNTLVARNATSLVNATSSGVLKVVCAWPVSGQYGPGSRILYYVLIATCVFARKAEWLRNACLAAALLFPAVAALHGIVLASKHVPGAVDMDVYGAFQFCSIGILAAPVTVRLSRTYFYDPGRNTIFLWTALILAGLLSLTIEFFRISTSPCIDNSGKPFPSHSVFHYDIQCGLTCTVEGGPFSSLRGGSANNIYVIPAPDKFTFDTATLIAAGCCIPAVINIVSMWNKILEINWKSRFGKREEDEVDPIEGTNGATPKQMGRINGVIRLFMSAVEVPLFGGAVLAILILGERNFWSTPVSFQTEPIASIGQWAPLVGTALAAMGSLYLLLARDLDKVENETSSVTSIHHSNCSMHDMRSISSHSAPDTPLPIHHGPSIPMTQIPIPLHHSPSNGGNSSGIGPTLTRTTTAVRTNTHQSKPPSIIPDAGKRRQVANSLISIGHFLGTAKEDLYDIKDFRSGKATDYPEVPGEEHRNKALSQIRGAYNPPRDAEGNATPSIRPHSRAESFNGSVISGLGIEGIPTTYGSTSFDIPHPRRSQSPSSPPRAGSFDLHNGIGSTSASAGRPQQRRATLEVPVPSRHAPAKSSLGTVMPAGNIEVAMEEGLRSPAIVVLPETRPSSPARVMEEGKGGPP